MSAHDEQAKILEGMAEWLKAPIIGEAQEQALAALRAGAASLRASPETGTCAWTVDNDGLWETACGGNFTFPDGDPAENHMVFCHCCGKRLVEVPHA